MEWKDWQNLPFALRDRLPEESGIYVVADQHDFVWYVGQASNLKTRWVGRGHHRYPQLIRTNRKLNHTIYWKAVPVSDLDDQEQHYVSLFNPELNGCKVKTYLPKKPQHEREIKRLLKTLNNTTLLFPVLRSVVVGQYTGDDGKLHLLIIITLNDLILINKSMRKRSTSVRQAWDVIESYRGRDEQQYRACLIGRYTIGSCCFEFISMPELINVLSDAPELHDRCIGAAELMGVQVKVLKELDFIDRLDLHEAYRSINFDGTQTLRDAAYLKYRKDDLKCLESSDIVSYAKMED